MFKSSSNIIRQASQRGASRLAVNAHAGRPLSTSTIRSNEQAEGQEESKTSRLQRLLLNIPAEYQIPGMGNKESRQARKTQGDKSSRRPVTAFQTSRPPRQSSMQPADPYAQLQGLALPPRPRRSNDFNRRQNGDGIERKPREANGQRPERRAQSGPRTGGSTEDRPSRQTDDRRVRAESSRSESRPRTPRGSGAESSLPRAPTSSRQPTTEPVVRTAPTTQELFGETSIFDAQSAVGKEVFEDLQNAEGSAVGKFATKAGDLDLLPPSPVLPQFLNVSTPREQINQFAVLQADYVLSRNSNVSLDQRGEAIGMVKQRLGA
ncbi:hypothetical protein NliqN6_3715 [Naganishia liquefaciens]|uniref:Uncharacterized protein n=1 Tax=Naganishia liquefaciens TaxID=104408 RepID=A0A8H3TUF7_9TREE|nr:hypothetical protein NliqN6_3715 [Naganishia liquefaciens]